MGLRAGIHAEKDSKIHIISYSFVSIIIIIQGGPEVDIQ